MKFKKGQKVKVKNKNEIIKWLKENSYELHDNGKLWRRYSSLSFNRKMFKYCGKTFTVDSINRRTDGLWSLKFPCCYWTFLEEWLRPNSQTFIEYDGELK